MPEDCAVPIIAQQSSQIAFVIEKNLWLYPHQRTCSINCIIPSSVTSRRRPAYNCGYPVNLSGLAPCRGPLKLMGYPNHTRDTTSTLTTVTAEDKVGRASINRYGIDQGKYRCRRVSLVNLCDMHRALFQSILPDARTWLSLLTNYGVSPELLLRQFDLAQYLYCNISEGNK